MITNRGCKCNCLTNAPWGWFVFVFFRRADDKISGGQIVVNEY